MYVIRSTHSSRLKRFPSRSMRSSYRTSMLVKDEADIVSLFIQYRGPRHSMIEGGVRSGVPREVAYKLTLRTTKGTAELLLIDGLEPMQLFRMVATRQRDRNASHIASARTPATPEFGAKAKTLDPDPQRPKPVAPAFKAADRASAYPSRNGARTGSAKRSSRQRPARTASPRASASARIAAWPTFETASDRGTTGGRIFRMSAVRRAKSGIAMARAIRGLTGSRVSRSGSLDPRITKPPRRAPARLS